MISPSGMRRRIVAIEQHDGTITNGEPTYLTDGDWDALQGMHKLPAAYMGVGGGEVIRGLQIEATATGVFRIPSTPRTRKIKPRMRVVMDGRKMNILSVVDKDGDQRELYLMVQELADS